MRDHRNETTRCLVSYIIIPYLEPVTLYFAQVDFVPSYTNQVYHDDPLYVDALDPLVRSKAKIRLMIFHELEAHHDHGAFTINRPVPRSYCTDSVNPISIGPRNEKDDLCLKKSSPYVGASFTRRRLGEPRSSARFPSPGSQDGTNRVAFFKAKGICWTSPN